jgi:hypothetical protein
MMRIKFHLSRTIKKHIILSKLTQSLLQPVHILLQLLESVENRPVRSQIVLLHYVF